MTIRDLLKKKERIEAEARSRPVTDGSSPPIPQFTFVRTDTLSEEVIAPPSFPGDQNHPLPHLTPKSKEQGKTHRLSNLLHRPKTPSSPTSDAPPAELSPPPSARTEKRLSDRLHLHRNHDDGPSLENVPADLPEAPPTVLVEKDKALEAEAELRWEKRATLLVEGSQRSRSVSSAGSARVSTDAQYPEEDVDIQQAIKLHEDGDLERSTAMFGRLADPQGANNALSQVLYGLALRHGWGIPVDAATGLTYLTYAASNSAAVESAALSAGQAKGGAAKGELVLAIFELANSFRYGWGVAKDPAAARQYYETAANLGDIDAMENAAWCYLEGFGGKKDKWKAAQFLRRAEKKGASTVGESWIWKDKYDPANKPKK